MKLVRVALALALTACGLPTGDTIVYPIDSPELANASVSAEGVWESAPWPAPGVTWLPYPGQATLEVEHGLGRVPRAVLVYISFSEDGSQSALASGDLSRVIAVDASTLSIRNDTNAQLFARFVAY